VATGRRSVCDLRVFRDRFQEVHEWSVSPDGERLAAPVLTEPDTFSVAVNGEVWEDDFEKAWHLAFGPDGRLTALVRVDDEWTVAVDGELWEERYEFAWNTKFSRGWLPCRGADEAGHAVWRVGERQAWETRLRVLS
jgi:hypothetical protein